MLRSELVDALCRDDSSLTRPDADRLLDAFFNTIVDHVARGGRVELRGFGSFFSSEREERVARNPRTGEMVQTDAKRVPRFRPSKMMLTRLNPDEPTD